MSATIAHLENRSVMLPDLKIETVDPSHRYEGMRGFAGHLAVFSTDGVPLGYIDTRTLGYEWARDWRAATTAKPPPAP